MRRIQQPAPCLSRCQGRAGIILVVRPPVAALRAQARANLTNCLPGLLPQQRCKLGILKSSLMTLPCSPLLHPSRSQEGPVSSLTTAEGFGHRSFGLDIHLGLSLPAFAPSIYIDPAGTPSCLDPTENPARARPRGHLLRAFSDWN